MARPAAPSGRVAELRIVALYGTALAALVALLKYLEYRFLLRELALEFYVGLLALLFTALGAWVGLRLTRRAPPPASPFTVDDTALMRRGISRREHEVLVEIAAGLSNQEIAAKLHLAPSTVKTHSSNLFAKLDVRRRTEALRRARELRLLP